MTSKITKIALPWKGMPKSTKSKSLKIAEPSRNYGARFRNHLYFYLHCFGIWVFCIPNYTGVLISERDNCINSATKNGQMHYGAILATGAVTGLNVFLLTQKTILIAIFTTWIIIILGFCVSAYAIYFIIHRHIAYYVMNDSLVEILKKF